MAKININNSEIAVISVKNEDCISLTDMAHSQMEEHIIIKWLSLKSTIEYIGEWEAPQSKMNLYAFQIWKI